MGVGNSKLNATKGEVVPSKILPTLAGKFEDFKKHRNAESTHSKKKLLNYVDDQDGNSQSLHENGSKNKISSSKDIQTPKEETMAQVIPTENLSMVAPMPDSEGKIVEKNYLNNDNMKHVNRNMDPSQDKLNHVEMIEAEVKIEEKNSEKLLEELRKEKDQELGAKGDEHDDDNDDKDKSEEVGRLLCPGSPSFKIYCIEPKEREESECNSPVIVMHKKTRSADNIEIATSTYSNEVFQESKSTSKRKGNKKKFVVMKSLLKVRSCYHPMCICTADEKGLVTVKATK